jgi:HlyD family secretion protein
MLNRNHLIRLVSLGLAVCTACSAPGAANTTNVTAGTPGTPVASATPIATRAVSKHGSLVTDGALALTVPLVQAAFEVSAQVIEVNVRPGQSVRQGDVLAKLDDTALQDALAKAQESLAVSKAQISQTNTPSTQADISNAQAALASASAKYNELKQGPTQSDIEQALRAWNTAKDALYQSQLVRDGACGFKSGSTSEEQRHEALAGGNTECSINDVKVKSDEFNERAAYEKYQDTLRPVPPEKLAQASADIASAQASLSKLQAGVSEEQKRVDAAQLAQAQLAVTRAQRNLSQATLVSPCDCTVQEVNIAAGATAAQGVTAFKLVNKDGLKFRSKNFGERDLASVKPGNLVTLRLTSFNKTFTGKVQAIVPQGTPNGSDSAYFTLLIDIDPAGAELLPGMTGQAEIRAE